MEKKALRAQIGITGVLVYRDAEGNVLKEVAVSGSLPLAEEEISDFVEVKDGLDNHE